MQKHRPTKVQKPSKFADYRERKAQAGRVLLRAWVSTETLAAIDKTGPNRGEAVDLLITYARG